MTPIQLLELLLSLSVQAAIVIGATYGVCRLVNDDRKKSRIWTGCYASLLLIMGTGLLLPHLRLFRPAPAINRQVAAEIVSCELVAGRVLCSVWLFGCAVSLVLFIIRSVQAECFLRQCRRVDPKVISVSQLLSPENECRGRRIGPHSICLVSSPLVNGPFCWQFHRPYIVIPECLLDARPDDLRFILRHEIEHLQTGHPLQVFLQHSVEIIFWFHPVVWWASQQSALLREFVCDSAAVENRGDIVKYLKTLLSIAEQDGAAAARVPAALAFGRSRRMLTERVRRLVNVARNDVLTECRSVPRRILDRMAPVILAVCAVGASLVWLPVNALASPRDVWSPWPAWTASVLHNFGVPTRDFEIYDHRYELHELLTDDPAD